jgi:hypothetical protein
MAKYTNIFTIFINHHICPIFHAEDNLPKLQFNFAHFIGPILTLRGPSSLQPFTSNGDIRQIAEKLLVRLKTKQTKIISL